MADCGTSHDLCTFLSRCLHGCVPGRRHFDNHGTESSSVGWFVTVAQVII